MSPAPPVTAPGRAVERAPFRFAQLCNTPRSLSPFLLVAGLVSGNGLVALSDSALARVGAATLTLLTVLAVLRTLRAGTTRPFVAALVLTGLLVAMMHQAAAQAPSGWSGLLTLVVDAYAIGLGLGALLAGVRLLSPLRATLLLFPAASTVAAFAAALEWRATSSTADVEPRVDGPAGLSGNERAFYVPDEQTWLGPRAIPAPGVGYRNPGNTLTKCCYPDNPRGYFDVEEIYGPQDMRGATLRVVSPAAATLRPTRERTGTVRVEPTTIDQEAAWRIAVEFLQVPLRAGVRYAVTWRARADRPRPLRLASFDPADKYTRTGLEKTFMLSEAWRDYSAVFVATRTSNQHVLGFIVGNVAVPVELSAVTIQAYAREEVTMEPARWRAADPATALELSATGVRLVPGPQRTAGADRELFPMVQGAEYQFTLRARAEAAQQVAVDMVDAADPATVLGQSVTLALTKDWNVFGARFTALRDAAQPVFTVRATNAPAAIDIDGFRLASHDRGPTGFVPPRYTVSNQLNAEGFRDTDHPLAKAPGTYRMAWLGDSFTFGQGVHEPDTFVRRVERALTTRMKDQPEAMNFGVCGYCTEQERACYEQSAARYEPDLVIVTMVYNDNLSYDDEKRLGFHEQPTGAALIRYWQQLSQTYEKVGYEGCVVELKKLDELCRQRGSRLAVVVFQRACDSGYSEKMITTIREGLKDTDVPILDLAEAFRTIPFEVQAVHSTDGHPNEVGHAIAADRIVEFLCREVLAGKLK